MNIWNILFILTTVIFFATFKSLMTTALASFEKSGKSYPRFFKLFISNKVIFIHGLIVVTIYIAWVILVNPLLIFIQVITLGQVMISVIYIACEKLFTRLYLNEPNRGGD